MGTDQGENGCCPELVSGFPEIDVTEKGKKFDTETLNILILCLGVMYGVAGANNALKAVAKALGPGVQKQLMKKALTKGTNPIVKSTTKWFGVKTEEIVEYSEDIEE